MASTSSTKARTPRGSWPWIAASRPAWGSSGRAPSAPLVTASSERPAASARSVRRLAAGGTARPSRSAHGQAHVAEPHRRIGPAEQGEALEGETQHLGIGRRRVGAPDRLDPGLEELVGLVGGQPEDRAAIAVIGRPPVGLRPVQAADGDGEFGPQAQFGPARVLGDEDPPADVLARQFEERLQRLQHRRRHRPVARRRQMGEQPRARRVPRPRLACLRSCHRDPPRGRSVATATGLGDTPPARPGAGAVRRTAQTAVQGPSAARYGTVMPDRQVFAWSSDICGRPVHLPFRLRAQFLVLAGLVGAIVVAVGAQAALRVRQSAAVTQEIGDRLLPAVDLLGNLRATMTRVAWAPRGSSTRPSPAPMLRPGTATTPASRRCRA